MSSKRVVFVRSVLWEIFIWSWDLRAECSKGDIRQLSQRPRSIDALWKEKALSFARSARMWGQCHAGDDGHQCSRVMPSFFILY